MPFSFGRDNATFVGTTTERNAYTPFAFAGDKWGDTTNNTFYQFDGSAWEVFDVNSAGASGVFSVMQRKTTTQIATSAALIDDNSFVFALAPNEAFAFKMFLVYQNSIKCTFAAPAGATVMFSANTPDENSNFTQQVALNANDVLTFGGVSNMPRVVIVEGMVANEGVAGDLVFQFAQHISGTNVSVLDTSWMHIVKM